VVKALANSQMYEVSRPLVVGDKWIMERARRWCGSNLQLRPVASPADGKYTYGAIDLLDLNSGGGRIT